MELYKKYRPRSFERVVGNEESIAALRNMLGNGTFPHTSLFWGPSGCGKTTLARIVQRELGCDPMDLREVNSSSYRGIDSVRDIARLMVMAPIGKCRVWIMDEVHKLSNDAQNAALKMLEDTPSHVYFLLCTTDPEKLIKPLRSRCCEFPVCSLKYDELLGLLRRVLKKEGIDLSDQHRDELAGAAAGSARTLLVLLDKARSVEDRFRSEVIVAGLTEDSQAIDLCRALIQKVPWKKVAGILKNLDGEPEAVRWSILGYARAVLLGDRPDPQAFFVIQSFCRPFYDSKEAGLAAACYEALHGE